MIKSLIFQMFTIWIYMIFCSLLLGSKFMNIFINMEWAIKILYLGLNLICENIVRVEENWMNRLMCGKDCGKKNNGENEIDDTTETFDEFIKKMKNDNVNQNNFQTFNNAYSNNNNLMNRSLENGNNNLFNSFPLNQGFGMNNNNTNNLNSAHISTLNFPNPNINPNVSTNNNNISNDGGVDEEKIKKLIDKMYLKTIVEDGDNDVEDTNSRASYFSKKSQMDKENKQIIFSRGLREIETNVPEPI